MTIKEMQKLYKNVNKVTTEYMDERSFMFYSVTKENFDKHIEHANNLSKMGKKLQKLAMAIGVTVGTLVDECTTEESFVRWCLINNIDWKQQEETETETDE